eukprot:856558-Pyramimonas_sp.AAC.1
MAGSASSSRSECAQEEAFVSTLRAVVPLTSPSSASPPFQSRPARLAAAASRARCRQARGVPTV